MRLVFLAALTSIVFVSAYADANTCASYRTFSGATLPANVPALVVATDGIVVLSLDRWDEQNPAANTLSPSGTITLAIPGQPPPHLQLFRLPAIPMPQREYSLRGSSICEDGTYDEWAAGRVGFTAAPEAPFPTRLGTLTVTHASRVTVDVDPAVEPWLDTAIVDFEVDGVRDTVLAPPPYGGHAERVIGRDLSTGCETPGTVRSHRVVATLRIPGYDGAIEGSERVVTFVCPEPQPTFVTGGESGCGCGEPPSGPIWGPMSRERAPEVPVTSIGLAALVLLHTRRRR